MLTVADGSVCCIERAGATSTNRSSAPAATLDATGSVETDPTTEDPSTSQLHRSDNSDSDERVQGSPWCLLRGMFPYGQVGSLPAIRGPSAGKLSLQPA